MPYFFFQFKSEGSHGVILFLYSLLFSRTLERYLLLFKHFPVVWLHLLKSLFLSSHFCQPGREVQCCLWHRPRAALMISAWPHRVQEDLGDTARLFNISSGNITCTEVGSATCLKRSGFIIPPSDLAKKSSLGNKSKEKRSLSS